MRRNAWFNFPAKKGQLAENWHDRRGSVLLEFVSSTLLLTLVFAGIVNMGLVYKDRLVLAAAVREAGRHAAVYHTIHGAEQRGQAYLDAHGLAGSVRLATVRGGRYVEVEGVAKSPVMIPGMSALMGGKAWDSTIEMRDVKLFRFEPSG